MTSLRTTALLAALTCPAMTQPADEPVLRVPFLPEMQLVYKVEPVYPRAAIEHRIQGTVRFSAIIGKKGNVQSVRLISGHSLLVRAARQAVELWVYRTSLLGDKPVVVVTTVYVHFQLDSYGKPQTKSDRATHALLWAQGAVFS